MNKEISKSFEDKLSKIAELYRSIIKELRTRLTEMGEQGFLYDNDEPVVPISYINDDGDEALINIDKIKADEKGSLIIHDEDFNEWHRLSELSDSDINVLIRYIDWK